MTRSYITEIHFLDRQLPSINLVMGSCTAEGDFELLITAVVETMQGLVGCRVDLNEEDHRLRRQDSSLAHQTERFSPSEYGKTVTDAEIEVQTHSPFCLRHELHATTVGDIQPWQAEH